MYWNLRLIIICFNIESFTKTVFTSWPRCWVFCQFEIEFTKRQFVIKVHLYSLLLRMNGHLQPWYFLFAQESKPTVSGFCHAEVPASGFEPPARSVDPAAESPAHPPRRRTGPPCWSSSARAPRRYPQHNSCPSARGSAREPHWKVSKIAVGVHSHWTTAIARAPTNRLLCSLHYLNCPSYVWFFFAITMLSVH